MHSTTFIYRVEGGIEFGLDSPAEESDENDETASDHYETTLKIRFRMDRCRLH